MSQAYIMSMDLNQILAHMHKGLECAICLELLNNPVSTKCDHQFCRFCITKFLQNKRSVPCPLCKVPVTKRGLQERRELYNIVNNVKKLISAYEADTGEKYSPSKRPQTLANRTSKRKSSSRKEQVSPKHAKSSPESQNRVEKSTGELENENASIFYTSGTSSKAAATARILDARDSSSIDSISSADEKTKTRHRKHSQSEIGDHSEIYPIETEKNLEKSNEWLSETARSTRSKSRTQVTGHQPSPNRASLDQVRVSSVNEIRNKLLDKHPAKTKSRKETEECMTETDRSIQCVEERQARRAGKDKKVLDGRNIDVDKENSSCSDELLRYLEEGSCGAAWNVTHETPKTQPDLTEQIKKSSHHAKSVQPNDTTHTLQNQQAVATKGTSKQANDFNSKKVSLRSSRSRVSLSPVKTNVLPTDAEITQHDSSVKDSHSNSSVQANVKDNEEQANVIPNDSKLFGKQQESSPCNARPDMTSPVSDVSSISSTQQLMKPKPIVSRTYTKDMQNLFRAEGRVRNWVGTLPEPHAKDEGSEMKQLRGLTTKEKINAKKRPPKKVKASPQTILNNESSADINSHQDDGKKPGAIRDEAALLHCSTEFQFELPLTPKPIRKCIFKSRHQTSSKESHTKAEITQEPLTPITSEDPYEFKGGQTPVKAKKIPASGRGKAKKSESKKSAKSASADVFKVPLELTHKQKGHTVTRHKDAASETAIEQAPTEQGQAPTNQDESVHNLETQESTKLLQNIKKLKTVHFAESHVIEEDTVPHKSKAKQKDSDKILNDRGVQSDVNKIHDNPHTDQHVTGADAISNMSSETATQSFMDNTVECPPELAESQAVKEIDLESTRAEYDENTTQVTRSGKSRRGRKGKHEKPMEETSGDGQKEQSDVEKIHSSAKKRKFARRNNRKAKAMDSETSSQRSGREMAKLIHKISEAEDYELMFSTQEARQNMLEEQLKQQNYNEAFGFDTDESILANISEAEKQPNQDSKVEEAKQQEKPLQFIEDEPFTDLQMVSEENEGDNIKDSVREESSSSVVSTIPGARNVICNDKSSDIHKPAEGKGETAENNDLNKKELITGELGKSSESSDYHNKKSKSEHCIDSTDKNMSKDVKKNLSTNYQYFTPVRRRACRFPRPNFSEMIQVSPGPGGLDTCSRSGQEVATVEETPLICSSLLREMKSDTEKKSRGEKQSALDYQKASQKMIDEETNASNKFLQNLRFNESSNNAVQNSLLSLKSRDTTPQAAAASEANKADVQVTDGAFSETVLAADTCVELDSRSEKENMLKVGDTVVQETMDIDANYHHHAGELSPTESSVHFTETNVRAPLEESETNQAKLKRQSCEVVAETQLRSTLSTQSPTLLTVHSTHDEHKSKETQVSQQGNYNKTDTTTIPDSCILINSEVSQRNKDEDGSLMARPDGGPVESGQSIESQCVLQSIKHKDSNSEQDVVISEKVHLDRDMAETSLNTNSFSSCIVPPSNNQTEDPKCKSHIIKQVTHQSTSKRKFGEVSSRSASLQVKTTPDSKSSPTNHISSAPSKLHLSDSEEEDSVLIVRRSKRKCLSLDGSPLKPVVFDHSRVNIQKDSQQLLKNVEIDTEMLGETEAMAVLDTWTEQEAEHGDEQMMESDDKGSYSNSGEQKELQIELPPEEMTPASPEAPYPLVEVTPVGKLKYINSSGKYIVDMNDRGFSSQTSSLSQKCLFPEATEKRLTRSALKAQKDERLTIQGQESSGSGKDNKCSTSELDRDDVQHANVSSKQEMVGSPNDSVNTEGLTEACLTRPVDVTPSGNMDSSHNSSSSERKRHTRRGLASKRMNLNLESLPKHPRGSLSPSSKAAIKKSVQKPETSTPCHAADKQIPEEIIDVDNDIDDVSTKMTNNITGCDDTEKETNSADHFNNHQDEGVEDTRIHDAVSDSAKSLRKNTDKDFRGDGDEELLQEKDLVDLKCREMDTDAKSESDNGKQPRSIHNVQCSRKSRDEGHSNKEDENEVLSFDLGVNLSDDSADEADNVLTEEAEANKKCGDDLVKTDDNKHMSHDVELENEEQEDDMKSSSSLPLTSSPLEGTKDVSEEEFDQSLIAAVDETISDSQDSVCVGARRKIKRQQISSDSEDSNQEDGQVQSPTNCTSSSAFSSQSETLTTQQQEALEGDLARLHKEIAKYEAELGKEKSNTATAEETKGESSNEISDDGDQKASNNVINESPAEVTAAVVVSDSEDSNDLFVSPVSPSPHGPANTKTSIRKPVLLEPKQADQMLKQFQSPGGTVRTKKALEFTMTNSLIQSGLPKDVANADKSTVSGRSSKQSGHSSQDDIVHTGKDSGSVHSHRPASPIILSQRSKHSQDTVNVDETKSDAKLSLRGNVPAKELCFVGSGLGREENLKVLRLVEQHSAKFTPKFSKDVSHVIMKPAAGYQRVCDRTLKFFQGVAHKCWVVAYSWVADSLRAGRLLPEEDYEIVGDTSGGECTNGVKLSRLSDGHLFSDFCFACVGDSQEMPKESLCDLLTTCGAVTVDDPIALLSKVATYKVIVRCSDIDNTPTSAEMDMFNGLYKHVGLLTVMREWVLDSLGAYTHLPMADYVLNTCETKVPF